jgi:hypothetical protein
MGHSSLYVIARNQFFDTQSHLKVEQCVPASWEVDGWIHLPSTSRNRLCRKMWRKFLGKTKRFWSVLQNRSKGGACRSWKRTSVLASRDENHQVFFSQCPTFRVSPKFDKKMFFRTFFMFPVLKRPWPGFAASTRAVSTYLLQPPSLSLSQLFGRHAPLHAHMCNRYFRLLLSGEDTLRCFRDASRAIGFFWQDYT